jgi:pimeloyl-ACP methyl ester carboxylesterase
VSGDEPGFVLVHGWVDSADCWSAVIGRLAAASVRVVCPDLPGPGRADPLESGSALD